MLFHLGALWRLNEVGYLPKLQQVSSVSGGSITAAYLGLKWNSLNFDEKGVALSFESECVAGIRDVSRETIDVRAAVSKLWFGGSVAARVAGAYRKHLFGNATLQCLPDSPLFIFNATNLQSGALWVFSKEYMGDWRVGRVRNPNLPLAIAVAASSAFPPFLSPLTLKLNAKDFEAGSGADLQREPYTSSIVLTDGGVFDNLGLETAWGKYQTVLVSNGGGEMRVKENLKLGWLRHTLRILDVVDNQVRSLRKRQVIDSFLSGSRKGAYWGMRTDILDYELPTAMTCPFAQTLALANTATRLKKLEDILQERIINWGYAVCDAAIRTHVDEIAPLPPGFPYPAVGLG